MLPLPAKTALGLRLTAQITMPLARTVPSESGGRLWLAQPWLIAKVVMIELSDIHLASLYSARSSATAYINYTETKRVYPTPGNPHPAKHMYLKFMSTNFRPSATQRCGFSGAVRAPWQNFGPHSPVVHTSPESTYPDQNETKFLFWNKVTKGCSIKFPIRQKGRIYLKSTNAPS